MISNAQYVQNISKNDCKVLGKRQNSILHIMFQNAELLHIKNIKRMVS